MSAPQEVEQGEDLRLPTRVQIAAFHEETSRQQCLAVYSFGRQGNNHLIQITVGAFERTFKLTRSVGDSFNQVGESHEEKTNTRRRLTAGEMSTMTMKFRKRNQRPVSEKFRLSNKI